MPLWWTMRILRSGCGPSCGVLTIDLRPAWRSLGSEDTLQSSRLAFGWLSLRRFEFKLRERASSLLMNHHSLRISCLARGRLSKLRSAVRRRLLIIEVNLDDDLLFLLFNRDCSAWRLFRIKIESGSSHCYEFRCVFLRFLLINGDRLLSPSFWTQRSLSRSFRVDW